jgi:hypothetical protein
VKKRIRADPRARLYYTHEEGGSDQFFIILNYPVFSKCISFTRLPSLEKGGGSRFG